MPLLEVGPTLLKRMSEEESVAAMSSRLASGEVAGCVQIWLCNTDRPDTKTVELVTLNVSPRQAWEMLTQARTSMMRTHAFKEGE